MSKIEIKNIQCDECPMTYVMGVIGGKWKPIIIYTLRNGKLRFGQLAAHIPTISRKVLTEQLKEMEKNNLITRKQFNEIPPRVEYTLTKYGTELLPIFNQLNDWGARLK